VTYDQSTQMPISGVTINMICPSCGASFDVRLGDAEPREDPQLLLQQAVPYRCPGCEHLGEVQLELQAR
jgi:hypothetical protein